MAEATYVIPEAVNAELSEKRARYTRLVNLHVLSAQQASEQYWSDVQTLVRGCQIEAHDDRNVGVKCQRCGAVEFVPGHILRYSCRCSPRETQYTFKNRITLE